jgi:hypothetical protein
MTEPNSSGGRTTVGTTVGFFLWRAGLLFSAGYVMWEGIVRVARIVLRLGIPVQLAVGVAFFATGFVLLFSSLILERVRDARAERGLKDM